MPIKIHHGPPGSYKTSGAMGDDFLREARAGRTIITNVRGVSRERTLDVFDDLPGTFDVIWIDDREEEGRAKLRTWFHWAPKGAFLFIDEAQDIWPRRWRDSDIRLLDYPGGVEKAKEDDRPKDWEQAWDKHRHWNWDLVLTTPNIKKIRDDIRGVADGGYKHKDLALIGWTGRYIEGFHSPEDTGSSESHFYSIVKKKVPKYVWQLYDSTATGQHSTTKSGSSLFKNPRILVLLAVLGLAGYFALRNGGSIDLMPKSLQAHKPVTAPAASLPALPPDQSSDRPADRSPERQAAGPDADLDLPFFDKEAKPAIIGHSILRKRMTYYIDLGDAQLTQDDYILAGYTFTPMSNCLIKLELHGQTRYIRCARQNLPVIAEGQIGKEKQKPNPNDYANPANLPETAPISTASNSHIFDLPGGSHNFAGGLKQPDPTKKTGT